MENNFEKEIRRRLSSMHVHPSDDAWYKIEKHLDRKRRSPALMFVAILGIICLVSATIWYVRYGDTPANSAFSKQQEVTSYAAPEKPATSESRSGIPKDEQNRYAHQHTERVKSSTLQQATARSRKQTRITNHSPIFSRPAAVQQIAVVESTELPLATLPSLPAETNTSVLSRDHPAAAVLSKPVEIAKNIVTSEKIPTQTSLRKVKIDFLIAPGITGISNNIFDARQTPQSVQNDPNAPGPNPPPGFPTTSTDYKLQPSPGYGFGINFQKPLTANIALSAGLLYRSYGVAIRSSSMPNRTVTRFYFMELPLSFQLRLSSAGSKVPAYWIAGIQYTRLIRSTGSHPAAAGNPSNDHNNKNQFGLHTSLYWELMKYSKHPLTLGPHFDYSVSSLTTTGLFGKKHLYFAGVRAGVRLF